MSAASSEELEQAPPEQAQNNKIIYTSYQSLIEKLQETHPDQIFNLSIQWKDATRNKNDKNYKKDKKDKKDKKVVFVENGPTVAYKNFIWGLLTNIIDNIKLKSSLYNMKMMFKINSFFTTWEEDGYPGIVVIKDITRDRAIYKKYNAILLTMYESIDGKLIDPSIFVNPDGSLNLGNTPVMAILRDLIRGCKRGTDCKDDDPDHLTLMHGLTVSPDIRTMYRYSSAYPSKGGRRHQTRYRKKTKASKRKTQKKSRKQRS